MGIWQRIKNWFHTAEQTRRLLTETDVLVLSDERLEDLEARKQARFEARKLRHHMPPKH